MGKRLLALLVICTLLAGCGAEPDSPSEPADPAATEQPNIVATLAVCGDTMSHMPQTRDAYDEAAQGYNYKPMIRFAKPWVSAADYAVVNLETTFAGGPDYSGFPAFNSPDALGAALADAGFDLVSTANNHCLDRGYDGLARTLDVLDGVGLAHVGTYRSAEERNDNDRGVYLADVGGIRMAFLSYTYGTNGIPVSKSHSGTVNILHTDYLDDAQTLSTSLLWRDFKAAKALSPDLIAVMVHWGTEYQTTQNDHQEEIADYLFSLGADIILGGHPHVLQPMETRELQNEDGTTRTGFVCWSLGNFISAQNDEYTDTTVVLQLELTKNPNTGISQVTNVQYVPMYMLDREQQVNGERYILLDAHRAIRDYEAGKTDLVTTSTYKKLQKCVEDCHAILGKQGDSLSR